MDEVVRLQAIFEDEDAGGPVPEANGRNAVHAVDVDTTALRDFPAEAGRPTLVACFLDPCLRELAGSRIGELVSRGNRADDQQPCQAYQHKSDLRLHECSSTKLDETCLPTLTPRL